MRACVLSEQQAGHLHVVEGNLAGKLRALRALVVAHAPQRFWHRRRAASPRDPATATGARARAPASSQSGAVIWHCCRRFSVMASHSGTSTGTWGSKGPKLPCMRSRTERDAAHGASGRSPDPHRQEMELNVLELRNYRDQRVLGLQTCRKMGRRGADAFPTVRRRAAQALDDVAARGKGWEEQIAHAPEIRPPRCSGRTPASPRRCAGRPRICSRAIGRCRRLTDLSPYQHFFFQTPDHARVGGQLGAGALPRAICVQFKLGATPNFAVQRRDTRAVASMGPRPT